MSVASAFLTDRQARLFAWLFGQPTRSFHLSELRRLGPDRSERVGLGYLEMTGYANALKL